MKAKEFDAKVDAGTEDILDDLDLSTASRPNLTPKKVNVDFPQWVIDKLDREATRIGVTRQSVIKVWITERLDNMSPNHKVLDI